MAKEIERKWLIDEFKDYIFGLNPPKVLIKQGYVLVESEKQLRLRLADCKTFLCLKYTDNIVRDEYEYEIPLQDGLEILAKCEWKLEKMRATICSGLDIYEVDYYPNDLMVAEIEFKSKEEAESYTPPFFFGEEITGNREYSNITLAKQNLHF